MILLALLRHAKAVKNDPGGDHARPLAAEGRAAAAVAGERLRALLPADATVIASDARRTRETAELAFPSWPATSFDPALYGASPTTLLGVAQALPADTAAAVMVGHNPGISTLAALLAGDGDPEDVAGLAKGLATADAVVFRFEGGWAGLAPKRGRLVAHLTRKDAGR